MSFANKIIIYILFIVLAFLDIALTDHQIRLAGGTFIELNPFMRWVMDSFGMNTAYLIRVVGVSIFIPVFIFSYKTSKLARFSLWFLLTTHVVVVFWHLYNIYGLWN